MPSRARTRGIRAWALAAVVLALLVGTVPGGWLRASAAPLAAGSEFSITSTISSSSTSVDASPALLLPGVTRYLWYTVRNPLPRPITVTALDIREVAAPSGCAASNLDLGDPSFTGAVVVPAGGTSTVPEAQPIALIDLPDVNQDACKGVTFTFTFTGTARYSDDPPPTPVGRVATTTSLTAGPNPVLSGDPVTLTARVARAAAAEGATTAQAMPTGTVTFHATTPAGASTTLGSAPLDASGSARLRSTRIPAGDVRLHATYRGSELFLASASPSAQQLIVAPPVQCSATYSTWMLIPASQYRVRGTRGNDFIYVVGGNHRISAGRGNDCIISGDGTNLIYDGSGSDVVIAGNGRNTVKLTGSRNTLIVGDGDGNRIYVRGTKKGGKRYKPKDNRVTVGNGSGNYIKVSKGTRNQVTIGEGARNRVKATKGFRNQVTIGNGAANRVWMKGRRSVVTVGDGGWNRITLRRAYKSVVSVGDGNRNRVIVTGKKVRIAVGDGERNRITVRYTRASVEVGDGQRNRVKIKGSRASVVLGAGTGNVVKVTRGPAARSRCSVPVPPPWWGRSPAGFYGDRITGCRVVTG